MKITVLDASTLGSDVSFDKLYEIGEVEIYNNCDLNLSPEAVSQSECILINKVKMNAETLRCANKLKLICVAATGFDNIDLDYCRQRGIAVCNVKGYSTDSVAQITVSMVLSLYSHLEEYKSSVSSGEYSNSGVANKLVPVYHEIAGKTWGIIGLGNIGRKVATVADALGCNIIVNKRTPVDDYTCTDVDTICSQCDIISIHTPLNEETRGLIDARRVGMIKKGAVVVNVARGAVCDEKALAEAAKAGDIMLGVDVYSKEPFPVEHPYTEISSLPNVCLTPHMAWGSYEARNRCIAEIALNIKSFLAGEKRNRLV